MKNIKQDNREIKFKTFKFRNSLYSRVNNIATQKARLIDSQIIPFIPKWQLQLIKRFRFSILNNLFGYSLEVDHKLDLDTYVFKRYGKILNQFIIRTVIKTK